MYFKPHCWLLAVKIHHHYTTVNSGLLISQYFSLVLIESIQLWVNYLLVMPTRVSSKQITFCFSKFKYFKRGVHAPPRVIPQKKKT